MDGRGGATGSCGVSGLARLPAEPCLFGMEIRCWLMAPSTARNSRFPCLVSNSKLPSPDSHLRPASKEKVDWRKNQTELSLNQFFSTMVKIVVLWLALLLHSKKVMGLLPDLGPFCMLETAGEALRP